MALGIGLEHDLGKRLKIVILDSGLLTISSLSVVPEQNPGGGFIQWRLE